VKSFRDFGNYAKVSLRFYFSGFGSPQEKKASALMHELGQSFFVSTLVFWIPVSIAIGLFIGDSWLWRLLIAVVVFS
jgi:hypothetical protein